MTRAIDQNYYALRARQERARAERATLPEVRTAHRRFAESYEALCSTRALSPGDTLDAGRDFSPAAVR